MQQNQGTLRGKLKGGRWICSHESDGEKFYKGLMLVSRSSGVEDEVPVLISDKQIDSLEPGESEITLNGSFRSRNCLVEGKSTLQLYFFVDQVSEYSSPNPNIIKFEGYICKTPVYRITPLDREICDMLIAVNRNTKKSDYIPCITWGRNAVWASTLVPGDKVSIEGRIQSRKFSKPGDPEPNTRTAYEVSISKIYSIDG